MEPGCTAHMGAHMGPIWAPYRLLAGLLSADNPFKQFGPRSDLQRAVYYDET